MIKRFRNWLNRSRHTPIAAIEARRGFMAHSSFAGLAFLVGLSTGVPACNPKTLTAWVQTMVSSFSQIKTLLPELGLSQAIIDRVSSYIDRAVAVASDFDKAYMAGEFEHAATLFLALGELVTNVVAELHVANNRIVTAALAVVGIARIAIANLLKQQGDVPGMRQQVSQLRAQTNSPTAKAISEIERLANVNIGQILASVKF